MTILAGATTALRRIVDLTLIGLIVVVLFGLILGKIVPLTGHQTIIIGGGSMEPAIGLGSAVVIGPVRQADLATGDVVSLQVGPSQTTFTHRIVAVVTRPDGVWIRTKGDANSGPDPTLIPATTVIGRVEWSIPWAGYLMALLSLPIGVVFVLGLACTLLAIAWLLESIESETVEEVIVRQTPDASRGEPISARPGGRGNGTGSPRSVFPAAMSAAGLGPRMTGTGTGASVSFRDLARPSVPEQLARSRDVRVRHNRWLATRQHGRPRVD